MPHFYTHVCTSGECARDLEGQHFPDLTTACAQARVEARNMLAREIAGGRDEVQLEYRIDRGIGEPLALLPISAKVFGLT